MIDHIKRIFRFTLFSLFLSISILPLSSQAMDQGLYFGFGGSYHAIAGTSDFDGNHFWRPSDFSYAVDAAQPEESATGLSGRIGLKAQMWAIDFQYSQTAFKKIESSFFNTITDEIDGNLFFSFYDLNAKYYLFEEFRAGMYLIMGVSYSVMTGEKIKWTPGNYYSTSSYSGVSANLGIGMDFYLTHELFLYGEYMYRLNGYTMVDDLELSDEESVPFHALYFGVCYAISQ